MKTRLTILCTACFALSAQQFAVAANVSYARVEWNHVRANVVYANMTSSSVRVTPALARRGTGSSESFGSMVGRLRPTAAITGTFFCTRSLQPTGDIVIEGRRMHTGSVGTGLCITGDGRVDFKPMKDGRVSGWQDYKAVMCAGPTLVRNGKYAVSPKSEGFRDPGLFGRKRRAAVGLTGNNKLAMVTVDKAVTLGELAKIMIHIGAVDAVDMDGGSSTALCYRGKIVSRPGRSLTNLLVVYETPTLYASCRSQLAPNMPTHTADSTRETRSPSVMASGGPLLSSLLPKPSTTPVSDAIYWNAYWPNVGRHGGIQVIGSRSN